MRFLVAGLLAVALSGCLSSEGGLTDFAQATDCPPDTLVEQSITVSNMAGAARVGASASQAFQIDIAEATGWNARQAACVQGIFVALEWINGATGGADLYVAVKIPGTGLVVEGYDNQQLVLDGTHRETVAAPTNVDGFTGQALLDGLTVHVRSDWASASNSGVPATVTVALWT